MHEIPNVTLSGDPDLSARINTIAGRLLQDIAAGADDEGAVQQALLERALTYAAEAERRLADQDRRIAYLQDLSVTDELTGLLNRRGFIDGLQRALAAANRYGQQGMLLYCDLDAFKSINDSLGHAAGDALLRHVAGILKDSIRECDILGRLGGDEFAIALVQTSRRSGAQRARTLQYRLESTPFRFEGRTVPLRISIGAEPFGPDDRVDDLLCRADMAMYCVKREKAEPISRTAAE